MELKKGRRPVERIDISINMEKTGANIRRLIKASGYSVRDIMKITGLSTEQAVYKWYRGDSIPALETQLVLCKVLGLDITELLVIDGDFYFFGYYRTEEDADSFRDLRLFRKKDCARRDLSLVKRLFRRTNVLY